MCVERQENHKEPLEESSEGNILRQAASRSGYRTAPGRPQGASRGGARGGVGLAELRLFMSRCREKSARQSERQGSLRPWELARDAGGQARRAAPGTWRAAVSESREELGEEDAPHPPSPSPSLTPPDVRGGQGSF